MREVKEDDSLQLVDGDGNEAANGITSESLWNDKSTAIHILILLDLKAQHTTSKGKASNDEAAKRLLLKHGGALVIFVAWVKFFGVNGAEAPDRADWKILAILGSIYFWYFLIYPFINGLCSDQRKSVGDEPQTVQPNASPEPPPCAARSDAHD